MEENKQEKQQSALDIQIDGSHYKDQVLQPIELTYILGASPVFCKAAKYLSREKGDKKVNLKKAKHCIGLEKALLCFKDKYYPYNLSEDEVWYWIQKFTKEPNIQYALSSLYYQDYQAAVSEVQSYGLSLGINIDEE